MKMDRGPFYTGGGGGGELNTAKSGPGGPILHSEKGPGVTFAIFLTFRGGSIFNIEKWTGWVHFTQGGSVFNG